MIIQSINLLQVKVSSSKTEHTITIVMINFLRKKHHYLTRLITKMRNMNLNNKAINILGIKIGQAKY